MTQTLGPMHTNDAGSWVRSATWTYYDDVDTHETRTAQGYATYSTATSRTPTGYTLVNPISITNTDKDGRVTRPDRREFDNGHNVLPWPRAARWRSWRLRLYRPQPAIHGLDGRQLHQRAITAARRCTTPSQRFPFPPARRARPNAGGSFLGTSTANYLQTSYGYKNYGVSTDIGPGRTGSDRRTAPSPAPSTTGAAIVLQTWMGTKDSDATDSDPTGGLAGKAAGNNMVEISTSAYNADDNLVSTTSSSRASTSYTTYCQYDSPRPRDRHGRARRRGDHVHRSTTSIAPTRRTRTPTPPTTRAPA